MSFTEVWGSDPDSAMKAQGFVRSQPESDFTYSAAEERAEPAEILPLLSRHFARQIRG